MIDFAEPAVVASMTERPQRPQSPRTVVIGLPRADHWAYDAWMRSEARHARYDMTWHVPFPIIIPRDYYVPVIA